MGNCFITRRGGGSGKLFAAIGVTYPAGSAVTCTNGIKTLTAKTTSGQWVFAIPEAGTWTVTSTDGTETASETVEITTEGQSAKIELSYGLLLYKSGVGALVDFSTAKEPNATISVKTNAIITSFSADLQYQITCITPKIDLTEFTRLSVIANCTGVASETAYKGILGVFAGSATATDLVTASNSDEPVIAKTYFTVKNGEFNLDITNINGEYKVGIKGGLKSTISEIRLRR